MNLCSLTGVKRFQVQLHLMAFTEDCMEALSRFTGSTRLFTWLPPWFRQTDSVPSPRPSFSKYDRLHQPTHTHCCLQKGVKGGWMQNVEWRWLTSVMSPGSPFWPWLYKDTRKKTKKILEKGSYRVQSSDISQRLTLAPGVPVWWSSSIKERNSSQLEHELYTSCVCRKFRHPNYPSQSVSPSYCKSLKQKQSSCSKVKQRIHI